MEQTLLIISKDQVQALRDRLSDPAALKSCMGEVKHMLRIKAKILLDSCTAC